MQPGHLFSFFGDLSESVRATFTDLQPTVVAPRHQLLGPGDSAGGAYLVIDGTLRVYYVTDEGREATLYRVNPGGTCVLALSSTLIDERYPAWVEAGPSGASFLRVDTSTFHHAMETEPAFRGFVLDAMSGRIFELMRTIEDVMTSTVQRRVAAYLVEQSDGLGVVQVTQERLAGEIGTAREVVFRTLRVLADQGLVSTGRGHVQILDASGLAAVAGHAP